MNLIWIFLPIILTLGAITSYEDIKQGKIRNKWIIIAISASIIIHFILYTQQIININYIGKIILFTTLSIIIGFTLYLLGMWSPGDAKLFAAYTSIIPLATYTNTNSEFLPLNLFSNTLTPIMIFLFIWLIIKTNFELKKEILKKVFEPKNILTYFLTVFSISWIIQIILSYFAIKSNFLFNILAIALIAATIKKIYPYEMNYLLLVISILRIFLNKEMIISVTFIKSFFILTTGYMIILFIIKELDLLLYMQVDIGMLKKGMIPAEMIIKKGKKYEKTEINMLIGQKIRNCIFEEIEKCKIAGMSKKDIAKIKILQKEGKIKFEHLKIKQTIPFAPFLFFGTLLTIIFNGDIILSIAEIIKNLI